MAANLTARRPAAAHTLRALRAENRTMGGELRRVQVGTCGACHNDRVRVDECGRLARHGAGCVGSGCRPLETSDDTLVAALRQLDRSRAHWLRVVAEYPADFVARPGTIANDAARKADTLVDLIAGAEAALVSYRRRVARIKADHAKVEAYRVALVAQFGSVEAATPGKKAHFAKLQAGIAGAAARVAARNAAATRAAA